MDQSSAIPELACQYSGIEGCYFLNTQGEFGYIATDGRSYIKETFPQLDDPDFLARHSRFVEELHHFTHDLNVLRVRYLDSHEPDIELGYLRPTEEGEFPWQSATLVLQKDVHDALYGGHDTLLTKGVQDRSGTWAGAEPSPNALGIHDGMRDLVNHQDNFGVYHYFPLLLYWPPSLRAGVRGLAPHVETAPMRVLNLMWRPVQSGYGDSANVTQGHRRCATVFSILRNNLKDHGVADRHRRVEGPVRK